MKVSALISFLLILAALVLCIISFSTYWYQTKIENSLIGSSTTYYKYNQLYVVSKDSDGDTYDTTTRSYNKEFKKASKNFLNIFNASLAFCVLAFLVLAVAAIISLFATIGFLERVPIVGSILPTVGKFIVIVATICALLSMFIFLGIGPARKKDCQENAPSGFEDACDNGNYDFALKEDNYYQGPATGWITMVICSAVCIAALIFNICGGVF